MAAEFASLILPCGLLPHTEIRPDWNLRSRSGDRAITIIIPHSGGKSGPPSNLPKLSLLQTCYSPTALLSLGPP